MRSAIEPSHEIVASVSDGQSLVEAATEFNPDVIVSDINMPVLNGIEAVRKLREGGCISKVVFLTVHINQDYADAAISVGAVGYVIKSRIASDLLHAIREALSGRMFISPAVR